MLPLNDEYIKHFGGKKKKIRNLNFLSHLNLPWCNVSSLGRTWRLYFLLFSSVDTKKWPHEYTITPLMVINVAFI